MKKEHFEMVLEDINGKMSTVIEGLQVLNNKIDDTKQELKKDTKELRDEMMVRFDYLELKLNKIAEKHEQRLINLETKVA